MKLGPGVTLQAPKKGRRAGCSNSGRIDESAVRPCTQRHSQMRAGSEPDGYRARNIHGRSTKSKKAKRSPSEKTNYRRLTKGPPHDHITAGGLNHHNCSPTSVEQLDLHHQVEALPPSRPQETYLFYLASALPYSSLSPSPAQHPSRTRAAVASVTLVHTPIFSTLGLGCPCCHIVSTDQLYNRTHSIRHSPPGTALQHKKVQATSEPSHIENNNPFPRTASSYHPSQLISTHHQPSCSSVITIDISIEWE